MNIEHKLTELASLIERNQKFVLVSHVYTDGDALGSMIAFHHYLSAIGKDSIILVPGKIPPKYHYLGTNHLVNQYTDIESKKKINKADMIIIFDISALDRLDCWFNDIRVSSAYKVCIDHHPLNPEWVDFEIVDSTKVATGELIYLFLEKTGAEITSVIAEAIYTAILSDSGSFRFQQTSQETFRIASKLVEEGVDPVLMYSRIFENGHKSQLQAWGNLLTSVEYQGQILWLSVSRKFMEEHNLAIEEIDGIVDIMRKDGAAMVFAVFVEKEPDKILVGLRSKNGVNVGEIARSFGGGGHFHAAGFTANNNMEAVIRETLDMLEEKNQKLGVVA